MSNQPGANKTILQFISSQPLFAGVSTPSLLELAQASRIKRVEKGACLFFQYDLCSAVYLVKKGVIAMLLENADGRELVINEMRPGDCFGELSLLTKMPHSTSAEAVIDSEVLVISQSAFQAVLKKELNLALNLLEITARRLQDSSRREEALAFHDAEQRLATVLLALDQSASTKGYLSISQEELAQRAGLIRQTAAGILGRWRRKGWLLTGRGNIVLLNRVELSALAQKQEIRPQTELIG